MVSIDWHEAEWAAAPLLRRLTAIVLQLGVRHSLQGWRLLVPPKMKSNVTTDATMNLYNHHVVKSNNLQQGLLGVF